MYTYIIKCCPYRGSISLRTATIVPSNDNHDSDDDGNDNDKQITVDMSITTAMVIKS
jgi:hypothetical protein